MKLNAPEFIKKFITTNRMDFLKVMSGVFTRNFLRGILKILVIGFLAPQLYGIVRSILSLFRIVSSIADLGLDYAMVKFVSAALGTHDEDEKHRILKSIFVMKIIIALIFLCMGNILAGWIAGTILSDPDLTLHVRLIFLALGGQLLWGFISSYLSAHQQFTRTALLLSTMPVLLLILAVILITVERFNLNAIIALYLFGPAVTVLIWWLVIDRGFMKKKLASWAPVKNILKFSRWIYISNIVSTSRNHMNPLLLKNAALSGSVSVGELNAGLYGFGDELAAEITIFSESLLTVMLPKASITQSKDELKKFLGKAYRNLVLLMIPLIAAMFLARPAIMIMGRFMAKYFEYLPALPVFYILYIGALFSIAALPIRTALYAMGLPHIETRVELVMLFILVGGGIMLIPLYGCTGAAVVVLFQRTLSFVVLLVCGLKSLKRFEK